MILRVLDTETTGLVAGKDKVVEIAWVDVDEELNVLDRQHSLIDPECHIPASVSGIHGITNKMVVNAPTYDEFFEFIAPQTDEPILMICHNAKFDYGFVRPKLNVVDTLCTLRLARHFYPNADDHKLSTLRYLFELDVEGKSHGAACDVETCLELLKSILKDQDATLAQMIEYSKQRFVVKVLSFGKHKGTALKDVPSGYRKWLLGQPDLDDDLRWSLENL